MPPRTEITDTDSNVKRLLYIYQRIVYEQYWMMRAGQSGMCTSTNTGANLVSRLVMVVPCLDNIAIGDRGIDTFGDQPATWDHLGTLQSKK